MNQIVFDVRAKQSLTLTPRLQQSVKLLQLSAIEFKQELQQALTSNPFLEIEELAEDDSAYESEAAERPAESDGEASELRATDDFSTDKNDMAATQADYETTHDESAFNGDYGQSGTGHGKGDSDGDISDWTPIQPSLHEHLRAQLGTYRLGDRDHTLASMVIEALDDDGYLRQDLAELASQFAFDPPAEDAELSTALHLVQQLDVAGLGARDLSECLLLQLAAQPQPTRIQQIAMNIVRDFLSAMGKRDYAEIKRHLKCAADDIQQACALIRNLNPRPGSQFDKTDDGYIIPDIIVRKVKGKWTAAVNPAVMPRARLNTVYADLFKQTRSKEQTPMAEQLQEARWLLRNVAQRFATILRVAETIVRTQRTYFEYGEIALKPMGLKQVAEELGLHESTVSRATSNKYMATPAGIIELKNFFSRELATESGGSCSAASVRALLREMIEKEDAAAPLSDVCLTQMLAGQGVIVARRTVAKYRGLMKVPAAEMRRSA
ncbi:MAG: RNA polymerase factor sigma-54 [Burkholderiaceae bacterium]|jgi:RNA polymerase sigma-54 factor